MHSQQLSLRLNAINKSIDLLNAKMAKANIALYKFRYKRRVEELIVEKNRIEKKLKDASHQFRLSGQTYE